MLPQDHIELCWEGISEVISETGHVILMGNQKETTWLEILSEPFQWIQIPGGQVPTPSSYQSAGLQCGR